MRQVKTSKTQGVVLAYMHPKFKEVIVEITDQGVEIGLRNYGEHAGAPGYGRPVYLDLMGDTPILHVWSDIRKEDPTHSISMREAYEQWNHEPY